MTNDEGTRREYDDACAEARERIVDAVRKRPAGGEAINVSLNDARAVLEALDETTKRLDAWTDRAWKALAALALSKGELDAAQRDLAYARAQLAALHAAAQRFRDAVSDDGLTCRDNGLDSAAAVEEEWGAIDRVLADLATAAAEHERRVRAPVEADRDQFAAALAEVRAASAPLLGACLSRDGRQTLIAADALNVVLASLPADLAAQREARVRADERAKALREAVRRTDAALEEDSDEIAQDVLAKMAQEAEASVAR